MPTAPAPAPATSAPVPATVTATIPATTTAAGIAAPAAPSATTAPAAPAAQDPAAAASPGGVVLALRPGGWGPLAGAVAAAAVAGCPLHLVVPAPRAMAAWALLGGPVGRRPGAGTAVAEACRLAAAAGVHVEVHPTAGRTTALAHGIARTTRGVVIA